MFADVISIVFFFNSKFLVVHIFPCETPFQFSFIVKITLVAWLTILNNNN